MHASYSAQDAKTPYQSTLHRVDKCVSLIITSVLSLSTTALQKAAMVVTFFLYCINSVIYMSCVLETAHLKVACKSGQILHCKR